MVDDILQTRNKKHTKEINIVPILDMLTTIIFFLLMSTSFMEYTKLTLPPASTVQSSAEAKTPPLSPKLYLVKANQEYKVTLVWGGKDPGQTTATMAETGILEESQKLIKAFSAQHPTEKTVQVSMGRDVKYQALISLMDASRDYLPDMVLMSYRQAETL